MDDNLEWRFEKTENGWAVVADNLPSYRVEITAVVPMKGRKVRVWTIQEQQQVIAQGSTANTALAKRACAIYLRIAKQLPMYDRLPSLDRAIVL